MANPIQPVSAIRPFGEDDYLCFGGAERFAFGGQAPVICEGSDRLIVADRNGVSVMFGDDDASRYVLYRGALSHGEAILIIELIQFASIATLKAIGFKCDG